MTVQQVEARAIRKKNIVGNEVVVEDQSVVIPAWVLTHDAFRLWAHSDGFPDEGKVCWFPNGVWVDMSSEQVFSHNQVKSEYNRVLGSLNRSFDLGRYCPDGILLSHPGAELSSEPDALFAMHRTFDANLFRIIEGKREGFVEFEGTPDMVLEIISTSSLRKDTVVLRDLYWRAGIPEYWLVDARRGEPAFDILRHGSKGYSASRKAEGWMRSKVFNRSFRLRQIADRRGLPDFTLDVRD